MTITNNNDTSKKIKTIIKMYFFRNKKDIKNIQNTVVNTVGKSIF